MALPSFTPTGNLKEILGDVVSGELAESVLSQARVTFVSNFPADAWLRWGTSLYRVMEVGYDEGVRINDAGDIILLDASDAEVPVKLLAQDDGLNVRGLQWQIRIDIPPQALPRVAGGQMRSWWIDAGADGTTVDLKTTIPVVAAPVAGVSPMAQIYASQILDSGAVGRAVLQSETAADGRAALGIDLTDLDELDWYNNLAAFPVTGVIDRLYGARDTELIYRWDGSTYIWASNRVLSTGITDSTAVGRAVLTAADAAAARTAIGTPSGVEASWISRNPGSHLIPPARLTYFDKPDAAFGSLPSTFDTGQSLTYANSSTGGATPVISNGGYRLTRGAGSGLANVYDYLDAGAGNLLRRIGFRFKVDNTGASTSTWAVGFSMNNNAVLSGGGTAYRMGIHISLGKTSYGITKVSNATGTLVFTTLLSGALLAPLAEDNSTEYTVEGWIEGNHFVCILPDGQRVQTADDANIPAWATQYGYFQHLMTAKDTDATPVIREVWYDVNTQYAPGTSGLMRRTDLTPYAPLSGAALLHPSVDYINDTNGNPTLLPTPMPGAVNYSQLLNAATGAGPTLQANGADPNIPYNIAGKGTGPVNANGSPINTPATVHAASAKTTPVDADEFAMLDSAASFGLKKSTFGNLKTWVNAIFANVVYMPAPSGDITGVTDAANLVAAQARIPIGTGAVIWGSGIYWLTGNNDILQEWYGQGINGTVLRLARGQSTNLIRTKNYDTYRVSDTTKVFGIPSTYVTATVTGATSTFLSNVITAASTTGVNVGDTINAAGFNAGTYVTAVTSTTITVSGYCNFGTAGTLTVLCTSLPTRFGIHDMTLDGNGQIGGQFNNKLTNPPAGLAVTPVGATGSTTYSYRVTAVNSIGETQACAPVQITNGNAALTGTNYNTISWSAVTGATSYNVYAGFGTNEHWIANIPAGTLTYNHQTTLFSSFGTGQLFPKTNSTAGRVLAVCGFGWSASNVVIKNGGALGLDIQCPGPGGTINFAMDFSVFLSDVHLLGNEGGGANIIGQTDSFWAGALFIGNGISGGTAATNGLTNLDAQAAGWQITNYHFWGGGVQTGVRLGGQWCTFTAGQLEDGHDYLMEILGRANIIDATAFYNTASNAAGCIGFYDSGVDNVIRATGRDVHGGVLKLGIATNGSLPPGPMSVYDFMMVYETQAPPATLLYGTLDSSVNYQLRLNNRFSGNTVAVTNQVPWIPRTVAKTADYTLGANEFVTGDATSAPLTMTFPTAPPHGTRCGGKKMDGTASVPGNSITFVTGGTDKINSPSGGTSFILSQANQAFTAQYDAPTLSWVVISTDFPKGVADFLYNKWARAVVTVTTTTTLTLAANTDYYIRIGASGVPTLPTASAATTNAVTAKNVHSASRVLAAAAGQTIEGAASLSLLPKQAVDLLFDGTSNWEIV